MIKAVHKKSGNIYWIVGDGKCKLSGSSWWDSVTYKDDSGNIYTQMKEDFYKKFRIVK